jgi:hypothetical protein
MQLSSIRTFVYQNIHWLILVSTIYVLSLVMCTNFYKFLSYNSGKEQNSCLRIRFELERSSANALADKFIPSALSVGFAWVAPFVPYGFKYVCSFPPLTHLFQRSANHNPHNGALNTRRNAAGRRGHTASELCHINGHVV